MSRQIWLKLSKKWLKNIRFLFDFKCQVRLESRSLWEIMFKKGPGLSLSHFFHIYARERKHKTLKFLCHFLLSCGDFFVLVLYSFSFLNFFIFFSVSSGNCSIPDNLSPRHGIVYGLKSRAKLRSSRSFSPWFFRFFPFALVEY